MPFPFSIPRRFAWILGVFALCASAEIVTRLSPSSRRTLETAGATLITSTPATVNGASATLSTYAFPAAPTAAGAETARLLNLPFTPSEDGLITTDNRTHLIVLPTVDPRKSLILLTQLDAAPDPSRALEFPKNLPHPDNTTPTFTATLDATQTTFATATSAASPDELHAAMRQRLLAKKWQPALPATASQSLALYTRDNANFVVLTAPNADGTTHLSLLQRLTSSK